MPRNTTTGVYTAPDSSWNPAVAGTVIDPDDWNSLRTDIVSGLNSERSVANIIDFGGVTGPGNDNSEALSDAIDAIQGGRGEIVFENGDYYFDCGPTNAPAVLAEDKDVVIRLQNATLVQNGDGPILEIRGNFTEVVTVSAITLTTIDMSDGSADPSPTSRITVSDASEYAAGDRAKIVSDDKLVGVNAANNEREGEFFVVFSVDVGNNYIYTLAPLVFADNYITNPRVAKMNDSIRGEVFGIGAMTSSGTGNQPLIRFRGLYRGKIDGIRGYDGRAGFVETVSCVDFLANGLYADNLRTAADGSNGYALIDYSSEGTNYVNSYGRNCRNGYTTGVLSTTADDDVAYYGRSKYMNVSGNIFEYMQSAGLSTHQDAYQGSFTNNIIKQSYFGYGAADVTGIAIRGQGHKVDGNKTIGGIAAKVYCSVTNNDPSSAQAVRDTEVLNHEHVYLGWETSTEPVISLVGVQTPKKKNIRVRGLTVTGPRTNAPLINFDWVESTVDDIYCGGNFLDPGSATSFGLFNFDDSDVTFGQNINLDLREVANTANIDIRTFAFASGGDTSQITCTAPIRHIVDGANNRWTRLMSTTNLTSAATINAQAETNVDPTAGWWSGSGSPVFALKAFLNNARSATWTPASVAYGTTGNKTIAADYYGNDVVFRSFVVTASGVVINNIAASPYIGQITAWKNDPTSTNILTFDANGTNMALGSFDLDLSPGDTLITTWDGTNHVCTVAIPAAYATAAEIRAGTVNKAIAVDDLWSAQQEVTITYAASVAPDFATFFDAAITLTGPLTLANGSNLKPGQKGRFRFVQDGSGGHALSLGTDYETTNGAGIVLSTAANAQDIIYYDIIASGRVLLSIGARAIS